MSFTKRLRSYFFRVGAPVNPNVSGNLKDHLKDRGAPTEETFTDLTASSIFFTESGDRAKASTGGAIENEVGHVAITTDAKAKAGTSGLEADRTLVVHAAQLPTVEVQSDTIDDFTGNSLEVTADAGTLTRNRYIFNLTTAFKNWLLTRILPGGGTVGQVLSKVSGTDYDVTWSTVAASGETNTASNVNVGGVGVFKQKTGSDLEFKGINSGDAYVSVVEDAGNNEIDISVNEAALATYMESNINLDNLVPAWNTTSSAAISAVVIGGDTGKALTWNPVSTNIRSVTIGNTVTVSIQLSGTITFTGTLVSDSTIKIRINTGGLGTATATHYGAGKISWDGGRTIASTKGIGSNIQVYAAGYIQPDYTITLDAGDSVVAMASLYNTFTFAGTITYEKA